MKINLALTALALAGLCLGSRGAELTFQQGLNGYTGTQDVTLRGDPPEYAILNSGGDPTLIVSGVPGGGWKEIILIRFDQIVGTGVNQIPPGATVTAARLELHKLADTPPSDNGLYKTDATQQAIITVFPMLTDWQAGTGNGSQPVEKTACYSYRAYSAELPVFWGNKNQIEQGPVPDVDYNSKLQMAFALRPGESNIWQSCDVTAGARDWVAQPGWNRGLYLRSNGYWIGATFDSSKSLSGPNRPRLIVEFTPPAK